MATLVRRADDGASSIMPASMHALAGAFESYGHFTKKKPRQLDGRGDEGGVFDTARSSSLRRRISLARRLARPRAFSRHTRMIF